MGFSLDPDRRSPKQIGAVLGLYDKPLYRDWLAWWTVFWIGVAVLSVIFPADDSGPSPNLPIWLNALLSALVVAFFLCFLPAYLRLLWRRRQIRRRRSMQAPPTTASDPTLRQGPSPAPDLATSARSGDQPPELREPIASPPEAPAPPRRMPQAPPPKLPTHDAKPARRPDPIYALDVSMLRNSGELSQSRATMPYPVARGVRAIQHANDMKDAYDAVLRTGEALTVVLGATATAWARRYGVSTAQLQDLQVAFVSGGVSQGHWQQALGSIERAMASHPQALPGMVGGLKLGKGGSGLIADLKELVEERNRWAHGGAPRTNLEAAERFEVLLPVFLRALDKAQFLSKSPWILTNDVKWRRREGDFVIHAASAMGDHPDFEHTTFTSPQALAEDVFYLRTSDGALDLTPLVVMRPCPTCHQREVAYADKVDDRHGVALKTFDRGHVLFDPSLSEEIRHLLADRGSDSGGMTA